MIKNFNNFLIILNNINLLNNNALKRKYKKMKLQLDQMSNH